MNVMTSARMTEADYDRERARIAGTKQEAKNVAGVRWEQELATLFYRSGWSQERLAAKERMSQPRISRLVIFGRFLSFTSPEVDAGSLPNNLSEKRFHIYWDRTKHLGGNKAGGGTGGNERIRFREITRLMQADLKLGGPAPMPRGAGAKIREHFADGKWHSQEKIAEKVGVGDAINLTLKHLYQHPVSYGMRTERKQVGNSFHFRFFDQERTVSVDELTEKLTPIIKDLKLEGKKTHAVTVSLGTLLMLAAKLQQLLDEWSE